MQHHTHDRLSCYLDHGSGLRVAGVGTGGARKLAHANCVAAGVSQHAHSRAPKVHGTDEGYVGSSLAIGAAVAQDAGEGRAADALVTAAAAAQIASTTLSAGVEATIAYEISANVERWPIPRLFSGSFFGVGGGGRGRGGGWW